jgi:hypothetical protein
MEHGRNATFQEVFEGKEEIIKAKVSKIALKNFTKSFIENDGILEKMPEEYLVQRHRFLSRQVPLYNKQPSQNRYLTLLAWAFVPTQKPSYEPKKKPKKLRKAKTDQLPKINTPPKNSPVKTQV